MTATKVNVRDAQLRFDGWGPGYLSRNEDAAFGAVVLRPGDVFDNHLHEQHTESFLALQGRAEIWINRTERVVLEPGDLLHALPGQEHFIHNPFTEVFRAVFVKTPWVEGDKLERPWTPEAGRLDR